MSSTDDSDTIDARAKELFDLCSARICDVLNISPSESAAIMLQLAADQLDAPAPIAPAGIMSGLKGAVHVHVAEPEAPPASFVVRW